MGSRSRAATFTNRARTVPIESARAPAHRSLVGKNTWKIADGKYSLRRGAHGAVAWRGVRLIAHRKETE